MSTDFAAGDAREKSGHGTGKIRLRYFSFIFLLLTLSSQARLQTKPGNDSLSGTVTLRACVDYALSHQPSVKKSLLDEEITERLISSKIADWYPQLSFSANIQHDPQLPWSVGVGLPPIAVGSRDASAGQVILSQTIFNRDVLFASSTASDVRREMTQQTAGNKIEVAVDVSKAFYAVLVTQKDIEVLNEDIVRLTRSFQEAYDRYKGGIADKTDYQRATISLNNAKAERKQNEDLLKARYALLKEQMGCPPDTPLALASDDAQMERESILDTVQSIHYENRIEFQLLQTERKLQEADLNYEEWSFLPTLTLYGNYSLNFFSEEYSQLYAKKYPSSYFNLQLSFPIFQGGKRLEEISAARLELDRFDYDILSLKNAMNAEYVQALSDYKSNLNNYRVLKENLDLARDVYQTVELQYKAGTKTYLEVITAETDLRAAQINRTNALYELLSSKLDVQRALGSLRY
ncbi:MAG TPA: TolC family protein [Bacteroidota bacterium]|nr:TolC family protein [Bacteroidota bacterium]